MAVLTFVVVLGVLGLSEWACRAHRRRVLERPAPSDRRTSHVRKVPR